MAEPFELVLMGSVQVPTRIFLSIAIVKAVGGG